jgi:hypothetical protein
MPTDDDVREKLRADLARARQTLELAARGGDVRAERRARIAVRLLRMRCGERYAVPFTRDHRGMITFDHVGAEN